MASRFLLFFSCILILSCSSNNTTSQKQEILAVKEMNNIATSEYTITKLVKANDNKTWYKIGDRKILLSFMATIKAGVNLSALKESDIEITGKDIHLHLPQPQIMSLNILPENTKVENEEIDFFRSHYSNAEQNELLTQAEVQISREADSIGIIQSAGDNAKIFFTNFLMRLGFKNIIISFNKQ